MRRFVTLVSVILLLVFNPGEAQNIEKSKILFFGDSITAGHGVELEQAYPAIIQKKIDSLGWNFEVVNGGLSGETSAGGLRRIDWMLRQEIDVFVLELGGNDGLRGIDVASTKKNLQAIIDKVREKKSDTRVILAGMQVPPNLGSRYTGDFKSMYSELAQKNDITLIPFILKGVALNPELMQGDDIHPNPKGHEVVAENVWEVLKPVLNGMRS